MPFVQPFKRVLIANRGEIAIRIVRAAAELGIASVAVFAADEAEAPHVTAADAALALPGSGPRAYLDLAAVVAAARDAGCDALHPGYGFLSENPALAAACAAVGIAFVGPSATHLETFGDKALARSLAMAKAVPLLEGTGALDLAAAQRFFARHGSMMLKATAGGGGRGMRPVRDAGEVEAAFATCQREAQAAFGDDTLYAEQLMEGARHIEVQIAGDGTHVVAVGDRDCSLQRRRQKLVEIAPAPNLSDEIRAALFEAATRLTANYRTLATVEFLVGQDGGFAFIEVNARLQVEHTVTEEVTGVDLVRAQFELAGGASLADVGLATTPHAQGYAIQGRVNLETLSADGTPHPSTGTTTVTAITPIIRVAITPLGNGANAATSITTAMAVAPA